MSTTSLANIAVLLLTFVVASVADPVLKTSGDTLAEFKVALNKNAIDHGSAKALAASLVRYRNDLFAADQRFRRLSDLAHLRVLEDHCAAELVKSQRQRYAQRPKRPLCVLGGVKSDDSAGTAMLSEGGRRLRARLVHKDGKWYLRGLDRREGDTWKQVRIPGAVPRRVRSVPKAYDVVRKSPAATVKSLRHAMIRLRHLGDRARLARRETLVHTFAAFSEAFSIAYLKDDAKAGPRFEVAKAKEIADGRALVEVTAKENIPGTEKWSAIGQFAFDLRQTAKGWVIVREKVRKKPGADYEPTQSPVGAAFLLTR